MTITISPNPYNKWLKEEEKGRKRFFEALVNTGLNNVVLQKNQDPFGIDLLIMLNSPTNCVGVIEIENSNGTTWDYTRFYKRDQCLPPVTWRNHQRITLPYRRLPRFLNPDTRVIIGNQIIELPVNNGRRFYQKWDASMMAFYILDFATCRKAITKSRFIPLPNNDCAETFRSQDWQSLFRQKGCEEYWKSDLGNWFINVFEFRNDIRWGAFDNEDYPVHVPVGFVWGRCQIKTAQSDIASGQMRLGG